MAGAGPQFSSGLPCHRCHCLCVNVERDLAAGVTQRLLFRLNVFIVRLQQRCVTVPECLPPNALANERQPPITLQRILPMEIGRFFLPQLPPEIAGNPTVVSVDTTVALLPVIELGSRPVCCNPDLRTATGRPPSRAAYCCLLASLINWATLESGPTGSTKIIWLPFKYMRSGPWSSLPRFTSTFETFLVSGSVLLMM